MWKSLKMKNMGYKLMVHLHSSKESEKYMSLPVYSQHGNLLRKTPSKSAKIVGKYVMAFSIGIRGSKGLNRGRNGNMNESVEEKSLKDFIDNLPKEPCFTPLTDQYCILCSKFNKDIASACIKGGHINSKLIRMKKTELIDIAECLGFDTSGTKEEIMEMILAATEEGEEEVEGEGKAEIGEEEKEEEPMKGAPVEEGEKEEEIKEVKELPSIVTEVMDAVEKGEVEQKQEKKEEMGEEKKEKTIKDFKEDLPKEPCFTPLPDHYCILCS